MVFFTVNHMSWTYMLIMRLDWFAIYLAKKCHTKRMNLLEDGEVKP